MEQKLENSDDSSSVWNWNYINKCEAFRRVCDCEPPGASTVAAEGEASDSKSASLSLVMLLQSDENQNIV